MMVLLSYYRRLARENGKSTAIYRTTYQLLLHVLRVSSLLLTCGRSNATPVRNSVWCLADHTSNQLEQ